MIFGGSGRKRKGLPGKRKLHVRGLIRNSLWLINLRMKVLGGNGGKKSGLALDLAICS